MTEEEKSNHFVYTTAFAKKCFDRCYSEHGFFLSLPDELIEHYFTDEYPNSQLFAIMFARWLKLPMKQIHRLERKGNLSKTEKLLKYFICLSEGQQVEDIDTCKYTGLYYVGESELPAHYIGNDQVRVDSTGEVLHLAHCWE